MRQDIAQGEHLIDAQQVFRQRRVEFEHSLLPGHKARCGHDWLGE